MFVWIVVGGVVALVIALAVFLVLGSRFPDPARKKGENAFVDGSEVASLDADPTVDISLVIPAYNEIERAPSMLKETHNYLTSVDMTFEMIVVDDGSSDGTAAMAQEFANSHEHVYVLKLAQNRGKGGAVRLGMLSARGHRMLMVDADGATEIKDLEKLMEEMDRIEKDGNGVVVGSRAHLEEESIASRSFFRTILMHGFHLVVKILCVRSIKDTQCGFKLFTRRTAHKLFLLQHIERWAFDVELLYIAEHFKFPISEVAVNWQEIDGSKVDPVSASIQMARDLLRIRALYMFGLWSMNLH
eukprot:m.1227 g.1227  ORF g.1227 m.1227 type:complete len:301 (+) comp1217_c0_seq1:32-934(+)